MAIDNTEPVVNNLNNPLISVLIYNYDKKYLVQCLNSIFDQEILQNFEVILIDDASNDGTWEIALDFVNRFTKRITFNRNKKVLGPHTNFNRCIEMAKGKYYTTLTGDQDFLPEYILSCVMIMNKDPHANFETVGRVKKVNVQVKSIDDKPLVSILCYNYNYGRYLRECLDSVFAQTYDNFELCFSDNSSSDDSWNIALEYANKYPDKMHMTRNRKNFGPDANFGNAKRNMKGKYYVNFCSDDVLAPEFVEKCVNVLEPNPNVGLVIVNRAIIDEQGNRSEEAPFYNQSCIIPGEEQAAVYMMAGVNPSVSQIMYQSALINHGAAVGGLGTRFYGTRILDFNISLNYDIGYIKEPLLLNRIHGQSDTNQADSNLLPIVGLYILNHQFAESAEVLNLSKVTERLPKSIDKVANLAVRYSVRYLIANDEQTAKRYFHLAYAINSQIEENNNWKQLNEFWVADSSRRLQILEELKSSSNLVGRSFSYDVPPGSIPVA